MSPSLLVHALVCIIYTRPPAVIHSSGKAKLDALVRLACILVPANNKDEVMFHFLDVEQ